MKTMLSELDKVSAKKKVITSIEFDCKDEEKENEVFDAVRDIVVDHLGDFAKITYDLDSSSHVAKVEVTENC